MNHGYRRGRKGGKGKTLKENIFEYITPITSQTEKMKAKDVCQKKMASEKEGKILERKWEKREGRKVARQLRRTTNKLGLRGKQAGC